MPAIMIIMTLALTLLAITDFLGIPRNNGSFYKKSELEPHRLFN